MLKNIINIVVLLGVGLFIGLFIFDFVWNRRHRAKDEADRKALEKRILHPDWKFYEQHLQRPAPVALRQLFADNDLVTTCGLDYTKKHGISSFNPIDENSLQDTAAVIGCDIVPFAVSDCGDSIFLRPGTSEPDTVYITYHDDPGETEIFAESVARMYEELKHANRVA